MNKLKQAILGITGAIIVLVGVGCDGPPMKVGSKPEDQFNPTMSAQQKQTLMKHKAQDGN